MVAAILGLLLVSEAAAQSCVKYEPARVVLSGTISIQEAFGPPGYGEDPINDRKERYLLLTLDSPICVAADPNDPVNSEAEPRITALQMVYHNTYPFKEEWISQHVTVSGSLFHAITGHHRTPVLVTVTATSIMPD